MKLKLTAFLVPLGIAIVAFVLPLLLYLKKLGGGNFLYLTDLVAVLYSFIAVVVGFIFLKGKKDTLYGKSLLLILLGIFFWFLADFLWLIFAEKVYLFVESLRLFGYIPMTLGFFFIFRSSYPNFKEPKMYIIILYSFFIFSMIYLFAIPILFGNESLLDSLTVNGYLVADFILIFGILLLIIASYLYRGTFLSLIWIIFALAFISVFSFDIHFASTWETYYFGHISELLLLLNYILTALGFYFYHLYITQNES